MAENQDTYKLLGTVVDNSTKSGTNLRISKTLFKALLPGGLDVHMKQVLSYGNHIASEDATYLYLKISTLRYTHPYVENKVKAK